MNKITNTLENYSVEIPRNLKDSKFILIKEELSDSSARWAIICQPVEFHIDIVRVLKRHERNFKIWGGGRLCLSKDQEAFPILTAYDKSVDFGSPDIKVVDEILSHWCANFIDHIKPTPYIFVNNLKEEIIY